MRALSLVGLAVVLAGCNPKLSASVESVKTTDRGYEIAVRSNRNGTAQLEGSKSTSNTFSNRPGFVIVTFEDLASLPRPLKLTVKAGDEQQVLELTDAQVPGEFAPLAGPYESGVDVVGPHVVTAVALSGSTAVMDFKLAPGQQLEIAGATVKGGHAEVPVFPLIKDAAAFGSEHATYDLGELQVKRGGAGAATFTVRAREQGLDALRKAYVAQVLQGGVPGEKQSGSQISFSTFHGEEPGQGFVAGVSGKIPLVAIANLVLRKHTTVDGPNCPGKYVNQSTGKDELVKRYRVDTVVEVYDTATGKQLGQKAFSSRMAECPEVVMKRPDSEASVGAYVDGKAIDAFVASVAR